MKNLIITITASAALLASASAQTIIGQLGVLDDTSGLSAGDQYRLVFVTSTTTNATSSNIADYNTFVQGVANTAGYGSVNWFAVGSTLTVDAQDNTSTNPIADGAGVAIFNFDSLKIADNNSDLWDGDIDNAIGFTENGDAFSGEYWSGSGTDGTASLNGEVLGSTGGSPNLTRVGNTGNVNGTWIDSYRRNNGNNQRVLAMSEILTVPVPEPSAFALLAGFFGLTWVMVRRRG
jgi:hypothetical protein